MCEARQEEDPSVIALVLVLSLVVLIDVLLDIDNWKVDSGARFVGGRSA